MSNRYNDLVLHLNLDDIDTSTITTPDSSKSGLKAKVNGASLVEDDTFGACLNFEGQDDHVEISSLDLTGANPAHTIEGWIKVKAYPQARSWILHLGQNGAQSHHWLLNTENAESGMGKKAQLGVWGDVGGQQATPVVPLVDWLHIAATYDGSHLVCYLNGQPIDKPKATTFNLTNKRLILAKKGVAAETHFQGKMAHVRVYRRALSEAEIREDIDTDRLALTAFRRGHPIGFSVSDKDENYVLYIGDDPKDHHNVNLELRNTSAQAIRFKKGEKAADKASGDNHHFELVFRSGVLSDKTLKKLRENKEEVIVSKEAKGQWDLFCPPSEDSQTGTISVYFLYKDTSKLFGTDESLVIPLRNISANAGSGARGTRIELKLNQLTYAGETTPITGSRIQHLQIISHLGSRRVPLHVGFIGSNRVLNDGFSANTLVLQLMNVLKSEGDTLVTLTKDSEFFISFDVQSANEVAPWSLCNEKEIDALKGGDSIIVAKLDDQGKVVVDSNVVDSKGNPVSDAGGWEVKRTDHAQGESPVWKIAPRQDILLIRDHYILIYISNIKTSLPSGLTNLYLDYKRIPGFWDGQIVCPIEKAPLLFYDVKDKQEYTRELRVGIGCVRPEAKLEIALTAHDAETKPLLIRRDKFNYLTVLKDGKVGIGKEEPKASLDVNGEIRANFFRAGEGYSKRLPVGKAVWKDGAWDQDIKWYRIAKLSTRETMTVAGAEFSLRATAAGRSFANVTFRIMSVSGLPRLHPETGIKTKRPYGVRLTILSNTALLGFSQLGGSFSKARIVMPWNEQHACEGYVEILVRQVPEGQTELNFSIYDNLNIPAWQPIAWEEQPATLPDALVASEYSLEDRLFVVADANERFSVESNGNVVINGHVGIGTGSPGAKLSIMGGLHVGGESDPGDKNLLVGGKASIMGGLHVGAPLDGHQGLSVERSLLVNGSGLFLGSLLARNSIGLLHTGTQNLAAEIVVEPALVFKTHRDGKWQNSITIRPPGGGAPTLAVAGHMSEQLDVIKVNKQLDEWRPKDHAIMAYFSQRLGGKAVGTMLRAITDHPKWKGHYWQGWVDADGKIRVIHNAHNTDAVAPAPAPGGGGEF
jgi:hypothetical protein